MLIYVWLFILQVHLKEPLTLFKFLSLLWGYNSNLGDQLDCRVSAILQTQALYVGKALLCKQPIKTLNVLASGASPGISLSYINACCVYMSYSILFLAKRTDHNSCLISSCSGAVSAGVFAIRRV